MHRRKAIPLPGCGYLIGYQYGTAILVGPLRLTVCPLSVPFALPRKDLHFFYGSSLRKKGHLLGQLIFWDS
jgi:hypothetical protein